jgi:hypothetical protein
MVTSETMLKKKSRRKSLQGKTQPRDACVPRPFCRGRQEQGGQMVPFVYTASASELAVSSTYPNPARVTQDGVRVLLVRAWDGLPPTLKIDRSSRDA